MTALKEVKRLVEYSCVRIHSVLKEASEEDHIFRASGHRPRGVSACGASQRARRVREDVFWKNLWGLEFGV